MKEWINNISKYPVAHIYAGMPQGKAERKAITVCETLYKFNFGNKKNVLGDVKAAWRELEVLAILRQQSDLPFRAVYIRSVIEEFKKRAFIAERELSKCFSRHEDLKAYYKTWELTPYEISKRLSDFLTKTGLINDPRNY